MFIDNKTQKAECIRNFDSKYAVIKGCCAPYFEVGEQYDFDIYSYIELNEYGEIIHNFQATIYDGSVDGYDNECGVYFFNIDNFNKLFKIVRI